MAALRFLVVALLLTLPSLAQDAPRPPVHLAFVGASVTAGFGSDMSLGDAVQRVAHIPLKVTDRGDASFFFSPKKKGTKVVASLARLKLDAVVAIDFLFWFAAQQKTLEGRQAGVAKGLALLESIPDATIFVGTVPLLRNVSERLIPKRQQIPPEHIGPLNDAVRKFCAERPRFHVTPLADWVEILYGEVEAPTLLAGVDLSLARVIQPDGLHVTARGLSVMTALALDFIVPRLDAVKASDFQMTVAGIDAALAKGTLQLDLEVVGADGKRIPGINVEFKMPWFFEKVEGVEKRDLSKMAIVTRWSGKQRLEKGAVSIDRIPPAAKKVPMKVRIAGTEAWTEIRLGDGTTKVRLEKK